MAIPDDDKGEEKQEETTFVPSPEDPPLPIFLEKLQREFLRAPGQLVYLARPPSLTIGPRPLSGTYVAPVSQVPTPPSQATPPTADARTETYDLGPRPVQVGSGAYSWDHH